MSLTPNEILDQEFARSFRGYNREEVDAFLEEVSKALSEVIKERNALKDELSACKAQVEELKKKEEQMREALVTAKQVCDEMKKQARKEAELIVEQAKVDAERIVADAHQEAVQLEARIRELRMLQRDATHRIRSTMEGYLRILDEDVLPPEGFDRFLEDTATEVRALQSPEPSPDKAPQGMEGHGEGKDTRGETEPGGEPLA